MRSGLNCPVKREISLDMGPFGSDCVYTQGQFPAVSLRFALVLTERDAPLLMYNTTSLHCAAWTAPVTYSIAPVQKECYTAGLIHSQVYTSGTQVDSCSNLAWWRSSEHSYTPGKDLAAFPYTTQGMAAQQQRHQQKQEQQHELDRYTVAHHDALENATPLWNGSTR